VRPARSRALSEIVDRIAGAGLLAEGVTVDPQIAGVADDSRRVGPGDLFCAWTGTDTDGHSFVDAAARAGAAAVLVERPVPGVAIPQVVVRHGRSAAAHAAALVYGDPAQELKLIGVTGTNGKTTTVWLLRHLLAQRFTPASIGTLGIVLEDGSPLPGSESLTTPGPVDLARAFRLLRDRGVTAVAMEVSSHALDQGRVAAARYDVGVFTNLTRDHLDYHGTLEAYREAKLKLLDLLRVDGAAVVNADDAAWADLAGRAPRLLAFSTEGADAQVRARDVLFDALGAHFLLETPDGSRSIDLPLLGSYNVQNALAAAAACYALGFDLEQVAAGLEALPQVPGRLERISERPCPVLRDYAHTPDALARALAALRPLVRGRLIVVFGAGGDRDRGKRPLMGAVAVEGADVVIVTSDNPRTEQPEAIIDEIVAGMKGERHVRISDRREAIRYALEVAGADDVILLAGKGHETYQILGQEKVSFDEREIVREQLALLNGSAA
jgi:UDP-N-acetylmuramoyl-L-alanyl-D-glutamate--2,6-diaminopimelate ligase